MNDRPRRVRPTAVAGSFYPADPTTLRALIERCTESAVRPAPGAAVPPALIVPHAGFVYSGPIAASAYLRLLPARATIRRVVLLGPSHRVPLRGLALTGADAWATPLGLVPIDATAQDRLRDLPYVVVDDRPHAPEHSLEVQLPFLQTVLDSFELVPIVVGDASASEVAAVLERLWPTGDADGADRADDATVVIVSTDLSHYHGYDDAVTLDARTAAAIVARRPADIADVDACGARPLRGLLASASERDLTVELLDLRNSGDTAGDRHRVVGYGAFAVA